MVYGKKTGPSEGGTETQGRKGVEAAAPTEPVSWDILAGENGGQGSLILLMRLFWFSLTLAIWSLRVPATCHNLSREVPSPQYELPRIDSQSQSRGRSWYQGRSEVDSLLDLALFESWGGFASQMKGKHRIEDFCWVGEGDSFQGWVVSEEVSKEGISTLNRNRTPTPTPFTTCTQKGSGGKGLFSLETGRWAWLSQD